MGEPTAASFNSSELSPNRYKVIVDNAIDIVETATPDIMTDMAIDVARKHKNIGMPEKLEYEVMMGELLVRYLAKVDKPETVLDYQKYKNRIGGVDTDQAAVLRQCIKTANTYSHKYNSDEELNREILNSQLISILA